MMSPDMACPPDFRGTPFLIAFATLGLSIASLGCGEGADGTGGPVGPFSCVASFADPDGGVAPPALCLEVTGGTEQDLTSDRQMCAAQGNRFAMEPCPHANALGGCRVARGALTITTWYYNDGFGDSAEIQQLCAGIGVPFVAP